MRKLSEVKETYMREEPRRDTPNNNDVVKQIEEFAQKKTEIIKTWSEKISDHPQAEDLKSDVGSAFDATDLDDEMRAAYEALDDGGLIFASFENTFWVKNEKKGKLIRVM